MSENEFVPEGAIVVRLNENLLSSGEENHLRRRGSIFRTVRESKSGKANFNGVGGIFPSDWRYATAEEIYCYNQLGVRNIDQITLSKKDDFKTYLKIRKNGNDKVNIPTIEDARPNSTRPRAIAIRKPTKQIAVGFRPIGNATKGKRVKKAIASFTIKTNAIKF